MTPKKICSLSFVAALFLARLAGDCFAEPAQQSQDETLLIHHEFLPHPTESAKKVEVFWMEPTAKGRWPLVLYIHGHQPGPERPGAAASIGWLYKMASLGRVAVAVSQPGYGKSDGPADYAGPFSQEAVAGVLRYFLAKNEVDANHAAIYGSSRGAIVAAMLATREPRVAALVLDGGIYDLKQSYDALVHSNDETDGRIARNVASEGGTSEETFQKRSALSVVEKIKTPTLILVGEKDAATSVAQARRLASELDKRKVQCKLVEFPGQDHMIPFSLLNREVDPFLDKYLR